MTPAQLVKAAAERGREDGAFLVASEALRLYESAGVPRMLEFLHRLYVSEAEVRQFVRERS